MDTPDEMPERLPVKDNIQRGNDLYDEIKRAINRQVRKDDVTRFEIIAALESLKLAIWTKWWEEDKA